MRRDTHASDAVPNAADITGGAFHVGRGRYNAVGGLYDLVSLEPLLYRRPRRDLLHQLDLQPGDTVLDLITTSEASMVKHLGGLLGDIHADLGHRIDGAAGATNLLTRLVCSLGVQVARHDEEEYERRLSALTHWRYTPILASTNPAQTQAWAAALSACGRSVRSGLMANTSVTMGPHERPQPDERGLSPIPRMSAFIFSKLGGCGMAHLCLTYPRRHQPPDEGASMKPW